MYVCRKWLRVNRKEMVWKMYLLQVWIHFRTFVYLSFSFILPVRGLRCLWQVALYHSRFWVSHLVKIGKIIDVSEEFATPARSEVCVISPSFVMHCMELYKLPVGHFLRQSSFANWNASGTFRQEWIFACWHISALLIRRFSRQCTLLRLWYMKNAPSFVQPL
jgi:hypothetical protein